jgi:hypothetical protein
VTGVQCSEMVKVIGDNNSEVISTFFNNQWLNVKFVYSTIWTLIQDGVISFVSVHLILQTILTAAGSQR